MLIAILFPFYVGGVFLFSYGYELYNIPRAIRLTAIIVFLTVAAVVIVAVLAAVLAGGGEGLSGGSSSKSSSRSSSSSSSSHTRSTSSSPSSSHSSGVGDVIFLGGSGGTHTNTVTREVVKEVEVPVAPRTIDCPFCHRSYVPAEQNYACPACGAATPPELIEESQAPKDRSPD
jgi:type IV secretory pathway TrbL component